MARRSLLIEPPTQPGYCRSCGAPIEWVTTVDGARKPFNRPVVLVASLDLAVNRAEIDMSRSTSHFVTCPQADKWRQR